MELRQKHREQALAGPTHEQKTTLDELQGQPSSCPRPPAAPAARRRGARRGPEPGPSDIEWASGFLVRTSAVRTSLELEVRMATRLNRVVAVADPAEGAALVAAGDLGVWGSLS